MGNGGGKDSGSGSGLDKYCYGVGFKEGQLSATATTALAGMAAAPCALTTSATNAYCDGVADGKIQRSINEANIRAQHIRDYYPSRPPTNNRAEGNRDN